jgi:hypothetical protein
MSKKRKCQKRARESDSSDDDHYSDDDDDRCFRCGRTGHFASSCFAKTFVGGGGDKSNESTNQCFGSIQGYKKKQQKCSRCGRIGHTFSSCFASTSVIGGSRLGKEEEKEEVGVYVLESKDGMYYIGKSSSIETRIQKHKTGEGAQCIKHWKNVKQITPLTSGDVDDLESWERNETLQRMYHHGIGKVRGWMFTTTELSSEQRNTAFKQICEKFDLCRKCGRNNHFAERCYAASQAPWSQE